MIITIDGPAGTGKTTVAKHVANELGYTYLDTGAMYRTLTYGIITQGIDPDNKEAIQEFLKTATVSIKSHFNQKRYFLNDEDVTDKIRTSRVTNLVSKISSYPFVREKLVAIQRDIAKGLNVVMEGRDIGTVVFPDAPVKVYLDASPEVRAKRRYNELKEKDPNDPCTLASVLEDINKRDAFDASRDVSPMRPAEDATIIDTSTLSIEEVVNLIIILKEKVEIKSLNP
jgi:cytidylate kinase